MSAEPPPVASVGKAGTWRARSVADELETIFGRATGLPGVSQGPSAASPRVRAMTLEPAARRFGKPAAAGALAAAGLVGLAIGALLVPAPVTRTTPARMAPLAAAPPAVLAATATPAALALAEPAQFTPPAAPKLIRTRARMASTVCLRARCSHAELLTADWRLRTAYSRAINAGVPRSVLVTYRNRWASLRHDAAYRPNRVASGYGEMAGDLNRMASHRRGQRHTS